ncbi:MAG: 50S ribosomal protein L24 [Chthoniobacterales bacterium]
MNRIKLHVHKGDQVEVISGNFKGSTGKVLGVMARKQRVLVEGVRMIKRHLKKSQDNPQGKIAEREGPIHISNVKVVERNERNGKAKTAKKKPATEKATKVKSSKTKAGKEKAPENES